MFYRTYEILGESFYRGRVVTIWFEMGVWGTITWHVGLQLCNRGFLGPYLRSLLLYFFTMMGNNSIKSALGMPPDFVTAFCMTWLPT